MGFGLLAPPPSDDLFFGPRITSYQLSRLPPRTYSSLHRLAGARLASDSYNSSHEHFLRIVPARFAFRNRYEVSTFQYSAESSSFAETRGPLPLVSFAFDLSPLGLVSREEQRPLYHFLTNVMAIIGGVFTLMGMVDSVVHSITGFARRSAKSSAGKIY